MANKMIRVCLILCIVVFLVGCPDSRYPVVNEVDANSYLSEFKKELVKKWPNNKTLDIVFHGHSVPAGYFKTPNVNTLSAYPHLVLEKLKAQYPFAVINTIVTSIGGENSVKGVTRFKDEVLNKSQDYLAQGGTFLLPLPEVSIVSI